MLSAILKAFGDVQVQERLEREDNLYNAEMSPTAGARKTMAILHMLTGYEIETKSKEDYSTALDVITDFSASSATPGTEVSQGIDVNPTVFYDQDGGMRPIIHNPDATDHSRVAFRLLDCRAGGMMNTTYGGFSRLDTPQNTYNNDEEAYDRILTETETFNNMDWIVRLANKQALDIDNAFENLKHARTTFDEYYYEDRVWREEYNA
ncbi:hypothetical protein QFC22_005611 [Naganishia vaughanmartiniae]|uniref:Uncharacterized protein n=1 Tax=Naganishia vaughanmartiniae TaxID=1424756 RepID=A0ACC2WU96_9TREE|nr:hypothetical protein QFC22_005611 [Naganishia vaughanmartiniae]